MKLFALIAALLMAFSAASAHAQGGPDDQYVAIYSMIQQADTLSVSGEPRQALTEYQSALSELQRFQNIYPDWSPNIVRFRLSYLADKISGTAAMVPPETPSTTPITAAPAEAKPDAALAAQLADMRAQVQNLQAGNAELTAKLKEALTEQPAAVDPRQLVAAQEKVRSLMKENDLLRVSLGENKNPATAGALMVDSNVLVKAQRELADLGEKLNVEVKLASKFSEDNKTLQEQLKALRDSHAGEQALRDENTLLKKQLVEAKAAAKKSRAETRLKADLAKAQAKIDSLQQASQETEQEKAALEEKIKKLQLATASQSPPPDQSKNEARIKELEKERDDLQSELKASRSRSAKKDDSALLAQLDELTAQVRTLEARLAVDEAQPVPYTEEELALFRPTPPTLAPTPVAAAATTAPVTGERSVTELPGGSAELAASASSHFAAGDYEQAAGDYQKILKHDENNGLALANLATIELQEGHLEDAEKHINAALAKSPNDPYNLSVLGNLKFQQGKFDEALNILSKAATLDPQNPAIQNYLGMTLGQKGLRLQAETALRKALLINPDYAPAHNNLAVVYISETPPRAELARWHYLKALAAGQPHNPGLEKLLSDNGAPIPAQ